MRGGEKEKAEEGTVCKKIRREHLPYGGGGGRGMRGGEGKRERRKAEKGTVCENSNKEHLP